jgi:hypothetical protein
MVKAKKTEKTHQYNKKHCSPFKKHKLPYSCLSHDSLIKIARAIHKDDNSIKIPQKDDKELYSKLCEIFKNKYNCESEACWLKVKQLMKHLKSKEVEYLQDYFRPHLPKDLINDYTEWLSNFDIEDVLYRHSRNLEDFEFFGAVPIDFRKCSVSHELCKLNVIDQKKRGINRLGMVFNTDESNQPGKHWMSMYIDLDGRNLDGNPGIYFFDSFGSRPTKELNELISKVKKQGEKHNMEFVVSHNDKSFQRNTYACGFYCMHFIEHMLMGNPFTKYLKSGLNDKKMRRYINHCYLHPQEIKC